VKFRKKPIVIEAVLWDGRGSGHSGEKPFNPSQNASAASSLTPGETSATQGKPPGGKMEAMQYDSEKAELKELRELHHKLVWAIGWYAGETLEEALEKFIASKLPAASPDALRVRELIAKWKERAADAAKNAKIDPEFEQGNSAAHWAIQLCIDELESLAASSGASDAEENLADYLLRNRPPAWDYAKVLELARRVAKSGASAGIIIFSLFLLFGCGAHKPPRPFVSAPPNFEGQCAIGYQYNHWSQKCVAKP
jgi:hypothetical protein